VQSPLPSGVSSPPGHRIVQGRGAGGLYPLTEANPVMLRVREPGGRRKWLREPDSVCVFSWCLKLGVVPAVRSGELLFLGPVLRSMTDFR